MQKTVDEISVLKVLRNARDYFDAQPKSEVYNSKKTGFKDIKTGYVFNSTEDFLNTLHEIGIQGKTLKEAGGELEEWYESLLQTQETDTEIPQYEAQTTTTGLDLETKIEQSEKRERQSVDIRSREKQTIDDFIENYQKKIKEIQTAQSEFEDKAVYAKVEVDPKDDIKKEQLEAEQQKKIEHYENLVKQEKFETAKQELAAEIEQKAEKELLKQGITKEEIKNIARETASEAIEVLSHKNENTYTPPTYQTIILATVATDTTILPKIVSSKAAELIKSSANNVSVFRIQPEVLARSILTTAFGDQFTTVVLGVDPSKIKISITNTLPQNLEGNQLIEYREVRLSEVNNHQIDIYQGQINVLNAISDKGREIATGYVQSNITGFLSRKIEALPAGSVVKKLTSTPEMQAVLFAKFGVGNPVTWQYANPVLMRVMGQNQLAGAFFSTVSKATGKQIVTSIAGKATSEVAVGVAVKTGVGASLSATLSATFGSFAPVVGHIIGAVVGYVGGELLSKAKVLWQKHKEKIKPILAGIVTLGAIRFLGVGPGLGVGAIATFGLMGTAKLSTIVFGGVRLLGLIGKSAIITISTPVIVTLLVLPPLVAFIMVVINNSAYVVPPGNFSSPGGIGIPTSGITIDIDCDSIDNSLSPTVVAAELIVCSLNELKLNPLFSTMIGNSSWQQLTTILNDIAIAELLRSANVEGCWGGVCSKHLQCVGFVEATAGQAYGSAFDHKNACDYIGSNIGGYRYVQGTQGIKSGDFFLINGRSCSSNSPGHIGVVISIDGVSITCADANAVGPGKVRVAKGCYVLSQITGYLRRN